MSVKRIIVSVIILFGITALNVEKLERMEFKQGVDPSLALRCSNVVFSINSGFSEPLVDSHKEAYYEVCDGRFDLKVDKVLDNFAPTSIASAIFQEPVIGWVVMMVVFSALILPISNWFTFMVGLFLLIIFLVQSFALFPLYWALVFMVTCGKRKEIRLC